jgi:hypothetical protein
MAHEKYARAVVKEIPAGSILAFLSLLESKKGQVACGSGCGGGCGSGCLDGLGLVIDRAGLLTDCADANAAAQDIRGVKSAVQGALHSELGELFKR